MGSPPLREVIVTLDGIYGWIRLIRAIASLSTSQQRCSFAEPTETLDAVATLYIFDM